MIDGYHKWLGIPRDQRPPTYYQLLGIAPDEQDTEVIETAAVRQVAFVRNFQAGPHGEQCSRILTELAEARLTLLNPAKRRQYDASLVTTQPSSEPPRQASANRSDDELANLSSLVTDRDARGQRPVNRGRRKGWSSLTLAVQCAITGFTLVAAYYLLELRQKDARAPIATSDSPTASGKVADSNTTIASSRIGRSESGADPGAPSPSELEVHSIPRQVKIALEGLEAEREEATDDGRLYRLPAADGSRTVRMRATLDGYKAVEKTLTPLPGERRMLSLRLEPEGSTAESMASLGRVTPLPRIPAPAWAVFKVRLDPVPRSLSWKASGLKAMSYRPARGVHLYQIAAPDGTTPIKFHYSAPGFKTLETTLTPRPGERQDLVFHFAPSGSSDESRIILTPEAKSPVPEANPGMKPDVKIIDGELRRLEGSLARINAVAITPDGKRALSAGADGQIRVYDPESGRLVRHFRAHKDAVLALAIAPTGHQVLSAGIDPLVRLWEIASGHSTGVVYPGCTAPVVCVAFTPKGDHVCAGDALGFRLWNVVGPSPVRRVPLASEAPVVALAVTPQGDRVYLARGDRVIACDIAGAVNGRQVGSVLSDTRLTALDLAPDGRLLILGGTDGTLRLWDAPGGGEIRRFDKHGGRVNSARFSSDGKAIVSGGGTDDPTIRLWDVETGFEIARFQGHSQAVTSVIFTPGGRQLLSGSLDRTVRLWDVPN